MQTTGFVLLGVAGGAAVATGIAFVLEGRRPAYRVVAPTLGGFRVAF